MKWIDFMKIYDENITDEVAEYILWNETAFPFSDIKMTVRQIRSAIRSGLNKVKRCELCGAKHPFHSHGCLAEQGRANFI